jgi:hypothetical protein
MDRRLCACGCGTQVTRRTEVRHQNGQGPSYLTSNILALNRPLIRSHKQDPQTRQKKSSHSSLKQRVIGRPPLRRALLLTKDPAHNSAAGEELNNPLFDDLPGNDVHDQDCPSQTALEENLDVPMGEPGPSGVNNDSLEPFSPPSVSHDKYGLSNLRRSRRIAECVERIGRQRWGSNHVRQFIVDDDEERDEEDEVVEENQVTEEDRVMEDYISSDEDFQEDEEEYAMPSAEPGQEGVSVWDLLGDGFLKEASQLGASTSIHSSTDV